MVLAAYNNYSSEEHRHAKRARVIFWRLDLGVLVELFTVMIWLSVFLGCDVQQEGNWKSIICKYNVTCTSVMVR